MAEHKLIKHTNCTTPGCFICEGGLAMCSVCNGAEASLPSECPGIKMTSAEEDAVQAETLDFRGGAWIEPIAPANLMPGTIYCGTTTGLHIKFERRLFDREIEVRYVTGSQTGRLAKTHLHRFAKWVTGIAATDGSTLRPDPSPTASRNHGALAASSPAI